MAAFVSREPEAGSQEDALECPPINRREARHGQKSGADGRASPFDADPGRTSPGRALWRVSRFFENLTERPMVRRGLQKQPHRFIQGRASRGGRVSGARYVQWHRVRDVLVTLAPSLNGELDLHGLSIRAGPGLGNPPVVQTSSEGSRAAFGVRVLQDRFARHLVLHHLGGKGLSTEGV